MRSDCTGLTSSDISDLFTQQSVVKQGDDTALAGRQSPQKTQHLLLLIVKDPKIGVR